MQKDHSLESNSERSFGKETLENRCGMDFVVSGLHFSVALPDKSIKSHNRYPFNASHIPQN